MKTLNFQKICATIAALRCLNAGQSVEQVAVSVKVSPQAVRGWLRQGGFRRIAVNGKTKYVFGSWLSLTNQYTPNMPKDLHPKVENAFQELDAALYSGDTFIDGANIQMMQGYLDRWNRALVEHRATLKEILDTATENE